MKERATAETDDKARLKTLRACAKQHGYRVLKLRQGSVVESLNPRSPGPFYKLVRPDGCHHAADLDVSSSTWVC
jgi:hypothetical protein